MSDNQNPSAVPDAEPDHGQSQAPSRNDGVGLRASDAEREAALRILGEHFADGRLERAEFDERADAALASRTQDQLRRLFADLPGPMPVPPSVPGQTRATAGTAGTSGTARWQSRPPAAPWAAPLVLVPVLLTFSILAALHGAPPFPLIALAFILVRRHRRSTRWNREVRPWT